MIFVLTKGNTSLLWNYRHVKWQPLHQEWLILLIIFQHELQDSCLFFSEKNLMFFQGFSWATYFSWTLQQSKYTSLHLFGFLKTITSSLMDRARDSGLKSESLFLNIRERFFILEVTEGGKRLPREVLQPPSQKTSKSHGDTVLCLLDYRIWTRQPP